MKISSLYFLAGPVLAAATCDPGAVRNCLAKFDNLYKICNKADIQCQCDSLLTCGVSCFKTCPESAIKQFVRTWAHGRCANHVDDVDMEAVQHLDGDSCRMPPWGVPSEYESAETTLKSGLLSELTQHVAHEQGSSSSTWTPAAAVATAASSGSVDETADSQTEEDDQPVEVYAEVDTRNGTVTEVDEVMIVPEVGSNADGGDGEVSSLDPATGTLDELESKASDYVESVANKTTDAVADAQSKMRTESLTVEELAVYLNKSFEDTAALFRKRMKHLNQTAEQVQASEPNQPESIDSSSEKSESPKELEEPVRLSEEEGEAEEIDAATRKQVLEILHIVSRILAEMSEEEAIEEAPGIEEATGRALSPEDATGRALSPEDATGRALSPEDATEKALSPEDAIEKALSRQEATEKAISPEEATEKALSSEADSVIIATAPTSAAGVEQVQSTAIGTVTPAPAVPSAGMHLANGPFIPPIIRPSPRLEAREDGGAQSPEEYHSSLARQRRKSILRSIRHEQALSLSLAAEKAAAEATEEGMREHSAASALPSAQGKTAEKTYESSGSTSDASRIQATLVGICLALALSGLVFLM